MRVWIMGKSEELTERVLNLKVGEEVEYYYDRQNFRTEENPDVLITRCVFELEVSPGGKYKNLIARMYREDNEVIHLDETEDVYRMPFIEDPKVLEALISVVRKQSHSGWAFGKDKSEHINF